MASSFDQSLELTDLLNAAQVYALSRGEPGSAAYFAAWSRFRKRIRTADDLQQLRDAVEARQRKRSA